MQNIYNSTLSNGYAFANTDTLQPEEIIRLRESVKWQGDTPERWLLVIEQSLAIVTVRDINNKLVGMACIAGTVRHAVICDLVVHPNHQRKGIGEAIMAKLEQLIVELEIKHVYAELAESNPFREKMMEGGFKVTGNSLFRAN